MAKQQMWRSEIERLVKQLEEVKRLVECGIESQDYDGAMNALYKMRDLLQKDGVSGGG